MHRTHSSHYSSQRGSATQRPASCARRATRTQSISPMEFAALILIAVLLIVGVLATSGRGKVQISMTPVRVETGETLWRLAQRYPVPGLTTAETVELIAKANSANDGLLSPGDTLLAPSVASSRSVASR